jgi:transcriptional regulator with XRE-family HTH domain
MQMPPNRIGSLLKEAGRSKVDLAAACEVGEMTIRRWVKGETAPTDELKFRMADWFTEKLGREISIEHLMGWDRLPSVSQLALDEPVPAGTGEAV